ncbi:hypothetical protein [Bradyrhizobium canariense]|uniref:Uncharacterized protein n=1 Tax=Bradyrhizobium canariense TaxID=255045 RepID=A0A1H2A663_9BRAD|nr:hypothetical protein [Bradyrhizobium canariense]SDT40936.1 hypothetical protein SAMN05444158_5886 [Bradyrhizobium canariense]
MSQISKGIFFKGIFGAIALSLTFGAIQFASGRDLGQSNPPGPLNSVEASAAAINRAGKADRAARGPTSAMQTQTISLRLNGLYDTSVLVRVPVAHEARDRSPAPSLIKSGGGKTAVACEPMVSVLTEVAKQLEPGRCVT